MVSSMLVSFLLLLTYELEQDKQRFGRIVISHAPEL